MKTNLAGFGALAAVSAAVAAFAATPPKVGDVAPDFTLTALDGKKVGLANAVKKGPVALIVLRGFPGYQCPLCTRQVGELLANQEKFAAANAKVILVYPGPAADLRKRAGEFATGKDFPAHFRLVVDPDYAFVNRYGLRWDAPNETAYPAAFVVNRERKVVFAKVSNSHGGRASAAEIIGSLGSPDTKGVPPATPNATP
jgi:thioredoxin-dependent peroxiredoxin